MADAQRVDLRDERAESVTQRIADRAAHRGAACAQGLLEDDRAVGVERAGVDALQRVVQVLRMRDDGDAVGQLEHDDLVAHRCNALRLASGLGRPRSGRQIEGLVDSQQAARQERIVFEWGGGGRAALCGLECARQVAGVEPSGPQLEDSISHGVSSRVARVKHRGVGGSIP